MQNREITAVILPEPVNADPVHTTGTSILPNPLPGPPQIAAGHRPARSASAPSAPAHVHSLPGSSRCHPEYPHPAPPRSLPRQPSVRRRLLTRHHTRFTISTVTPSPGRCLLSHRPPPHQHDGPKVSVVPWFISTASHSDFSHGITDDFTSRLIRPATQPRRAGPYETSRGNAENFPTAPPAHTLLCPGAPSTSFASVVQARHHLDRADRFANFGYGSVFRLKPFGPHLTMGALSCAAVQAYPAAHNHYHRVNPPNNARRGITPAFGYGPRLGPVRLDFHQLALCAARRTLRPLRLPLGRPPFPGFTGNRPTRSRPPQGRGRGGPLQFPRHLLHVPRPLRRRVPRRPLQVPRRFHGLRQIHTGSAPSVLRQGGSLHDAADFASCCGPDSCSTPLRPRPLNRTRGLRYRGPWRLPGPDSHRLAAASFSPGYVMTAPSRSCARAYWTHVDPGSAQGVRHPQPTFGGYSMPGWFHSGVAQRGGIVDPPDIAQRGEHAGESVAARVLGEAPFRLGQPVGEPESQTGVGSNPRTPSNRDAYGARVRPHPRPPFPRVR